LWLRPARAARGGNPARPAVWVILDGSRQLGTDAGANDIGRAQAALARHLAAQHKPPAGADRPDQLLVDEVMTAYLSEHAARSPSRDWIAHTAAPILDWWSGKRLDEVSGPTCRAYVDWRTAQAVKRIKTGPARTVSDQTARHELKTLRTAINYYHAEQGPLLSVPKVTLPAPTPQKDDYYLTRSEAAARIWAARQREETRHVARLILIGIYSGTRPGAILKLQWLPSISGGWADVDNAVLHRRGIGARRSRKRQPPAAIHVRLLPHLRRWKRIDAAIGATHIVHYRGAAVAKLRRSWGSVRALAVAALTRALKTRRLNLPPNALTRIDAPHIVRHTAATWQMQSGTELAEAAGYLGMTPETLWTVYGHHSPHFQKTASQSRGRRA
ncbi:MAG: hypothetical protein ABL901_03880, partial [Hyphomicrobiaceae bacterium]